MASSWCQFLQNFKVRGFRLGLLGFKPERLQKLYTPTFGPDPTHRTPSLWTVNGYLDRPLAPEMYERQPSKEIRGWLSLSEVSCPTFPNKIQPFQPNGHDLNPY